MAEVIRQRQRYQVGFLVYEKALATSISMPIEMLKAGAAYGLRHNRKVDALDIKLVSDSLYPIESQAGLKLVPDTTIGNSGQLDLIIVPSLWRNPRTVIQKHPAIINWLKYQRSQGATLIGVGTGVCFIAEAGLLDGHSATTHWHYFQQFERDYPKVELKPDYFITQAEGLYCAASLNALADIIVHIIEMQWGAEASQNVQRNFSHEVRKPYEQQRYLEGSVDKHPDELVAQVQFWMKQNLDSEWSLAEVANYFGLSLRTLNRRFKLAVGESPGQYWQTLKLQTVKDLLAGSNLSIQDIALAVGYSDQSQLTRFFKNHSNISPKDYRMLVRKKLFESDV